MLEVKNAVPLGFVIVANPYGVAKYACEMDIKIAGEQHGLDWCIIRPHNVYGIKQNIQFVFVLECDLANSTNITKTIYSRRSKCKLLWKLWS